MVPLATRWMNISLRSMYHAHTMYFSYRQVFAFAIRKVSYFFMKLDGILKMTPWNVGSYHAHTVSDTVEFLIPN